MSSLPAIDPAALHDDAFARYYLTINCLRVTLAQGGRR